jgi:hypothetical protein
MDLARFSYALERWNYFDTKRMKLLVLVKETLHVGERDEARKALIASVDTSYMWTSNVCELWRDAKVQMCAV